MSVEQLSFKINLEHVSSSGRFGGSIPSFAESKGCDHNDDTDGINTPKENHSFLSTLSAGMHGFRGRSYSTRTAKEHKENEEKATIVTASSSSGHQNGFLTPQVPRVRRASAFIMSLLARSKRGTGENSELGSKDSLESEELRLRQTMVNLQMESSPFNTHHSFDPSDAEIDLLRRSWSDEFDFLYNFGTDIYAHIFEEAPDARHLFPSLLEAGDRWRDTSAFRNQALKFVQVISYTIKNLTHPKQRESYLARIGAAHVRLIEKGFLPNYWILAKDAIEFAIRQRIEQRTCPRLNSSETPAVVEVWGKLAVHIVDAMHAGFVEGLQEHNAKWHSSYMKQHLNMPNGNTITTTSTSNTNGSFHENGKKTT